MSVVNHWGKWVSTSLPVTGVVSLNSLERIHDLVNYGNAINISQIDRLEEYKREKTREMESAYFDSLPDGALVEEQMPTAEEVEQWTQEFYEQDDEMGDSYIVGAWRKDDQGLYEPDDLTTENDFAAIVRYDSGVAQVVSSLWAIRAELCSPCYPGQAHLDGNGEFMGYDFPDWVYGDRRVNRDAVRFHRTDKEGKFWSVIAPAINRMIGLDDGAITPVNPF